MSKTKSTSTEIKEILSNLKDLGNARSELDKKAAVAGKDAVGILKDLVTANSHILALRWNQYTPYFDDGDTCEFSVNSLEIQFDDVITGAGDKAGNKKSKEDDEDEDAESEWVDFGEYGEDLKEYFEKRKDVLNYKDLDELEKAVKAAYDIHEKLQTMESVLLLAFGDHTQVTVTRKGIETDSYDHD